LLYLNYRRQNNAASVERFGPGELTVQKLLQQRVADVAGFLVLAGFVNDRLGVGWPDRDGYPVPPARLQTPFVGPGDALGRDLKYGVGAYRDAYYRSRSWLY